MIIGFITPHYSTGGKEENDTLLTEAVHLFKTASEDIQKEAKRESTDRQKDINVFCSSYKTAKDSWDLLNVELKVPNDNVMICDELRPFNIGANNEEEFRSLYPEYVGVYTEQAGEALAMLDIMTGNNQNITSKKFDALLASAKLFVDNVLETNKAEASYTLPIIISHKWVIQAIYLAITNDAHNAINKSVDIMPTRFFTLDTSNNKTSTMLFK